MRNLVIDLLKRFDGHPKKSRKPVKTDSGKHFTQKEIDANMELAVNTLIGVKCKKNYPHPR